METAMVEYPWFCLNMLAVLWIAAVSIRTMMASKICSSSLSSSSFPRLAEADKRNVLVAFMHLIVTTVAFILQLIFSWDVLMSTSSGQHVNERNFDGMMVTIQALSILHLWDLCYRIRVSRIIVVNHVLFLVLIQLLMASFLDTQDFVYFRLSVLVAFFPTTEQFDQVSRCCRILKIGDGGSGGSTSPNRCKVVLSCLAVVQAVLLKTSICIVALFDFIAAFYVNGNELHNHNVWKNFWKYSFLPYLFVLYFVQLYRCCLWKGRKEKVPTKFVVSDTSTILSTEKDDSYFTASDSAASSQPGNLHHIEEGEVRMVVLAEGMPLLETTMAELDLEAPSSSSSSATTSTTTSPSPSVPAHHQKKRRTRRGSKSKPKDLPTVVYHGTQPTSSPTYAPTDEMATTSRKPNRRRKTDVSTVNSADDAAENIAYESQPTTVVTSITPKSIMHHTDFEVPSSPTIGDDAAFHKELISILKREEYPKNVSFSPHVRVRNIEAKTDPDVRSLLWYDDPIQESTF